MSQQKPDPARLRPRRATVQSKTPPGNGSQSPEKAPAQPAPDDHEGWKTYWEERQQPWRIEPEIDEKRQSELGTRRVIVPNIEKGIYPFKGMKLNRADIEWLLATHENGRGPVDWNDASQREREGLDLRGSNLQQADLHGLPLARTHGGLYGERWVGATNEQRLMAAVHLEGCTLRWSHLEGSKLTYAHLEGSDLREAHLEGADLNSARFTQRKGDVSFSADLRKAFFDTETIFRHSALCDEDGRGIQLVDIHWTGVNLTAVDWTSVKMLGDEYEAKQKKDPDGTLRTQNVRLIRYQAAVRANRQLAILLQNQGLNEDAARFAYRANMLQRKVLWFQMLQRKVSLRQRIRKLGAWVFSHPLNLVAGYGYRPARSFVAYLLVIFGFMGLYLLTSQLTTPHLRWDEALVLSLSSFHGRGFFPQTITLGDPYARLAVTEAVLGLFIEISFIATFTQRFFGK